MQNIYRRVLTSSNSDKDNKHVRSAAKEKIVTFFNVTVNRERRSKINLTNELINTQNSNDTKTKSSIDETLEDYDRQELLTKKNPI